MFGSNTASFVLLLSCIVCLGIAQRLPTPVRITVPSRTLTHVRVNWMQPPTIKYARFLLKISPRATILDPEKPDDTSRTFTDLQPGIAYTVTLRGETSDRRRSAPLRFHIWSKPKKPSNLVLSPIRQVNLAVKLAEYEDTYSAPVVGVHVDWEKPQGPTGLSGYKVSMNPKEDCAMLYPQPNKGEVPDDTSRTFVGLTPGQDYTFTVQTKTGPPYDLVLSEPISDRAVVPPATPFSVEVTEEGATYATVSTMGPVDGIHDGLELVLEPNHGVIGPPSLDPIYNRFNVYTITGLRPGTTYKLNVYSVSKGVRSWEPFTVEINTKPTAPMLLSVTSFDSTSVTLQWDQPQSDVGEGEVVDYLLRYMDIEGTVAGGSETIRVQPGATNVHARIQKLVPGVTYKFMVYTKTDGSDPTLQGDVVQTTLPPLPVVATMDPTNGGVILVFSRPPIGRCPVTKVHVSPGKTDTTPTFYELGEEIYLSNLPREERYTIHARCVSNNLEGPELTVSSRAIVDPETGRIRNPANLPRRALPCIVARNLPRVLPRPEAVAPDSCCGARPYHSSTQSCCGETLLRQELNQMCCKSTPYTKTISVCCFDGIVRPQNVGCDGV